MAEEFFVERLRGCFQLLMEGNVRFDTASQRAVLSLLGDVERRSLPVIGQGNFGNREYICCKGIGASLVVFPRMTDAG